MRDVVWLPMGGELVDHIVDRLAHLDHDQKRSAAFLGASVGIPPGSSQNEAPLPRRLLPHHLLGAFPAWRLKSATLNP